MSDIKDRLNRIMKMQSGLMVGSQWRKGAEELAERRAAGEFELEKFVPGEIIENDFGSFYIVRKEWPFDARQGNISLGDALLALPEHIALSANDTELEDFDPRKAIFMDTETTGLAGGSGTVAFLVGVGYFDEDKFKLEQVFMRDFDEEEAMLSYLDGLFKNRDTVVTYNGKSYDIPLLRTRFIQNRIPFRLDTVLQYDLLHAARRFWKRRLGDCSLGNIEREILAVRRHGDVPGAEIPMIWLNYLRTRDATKIKAVFYHHEMDILSLAALTGRLSQNLSASEDGGFKHHEDKLSHVRVNFIQKKYPQVLEHGRLLLDEEIASGLRRECLYLMGMAAKRLQKWLDAQKLWDDLLHENPRDIIARLELVKLHEHRTKNLPEAERICQETITCLETRQSLNTGQYGRQIDDNTSNEIQAFRTRLARIQRKLRRG